MFSITYFIIFPMCCFWNSYNVRRPTDDSPLTPSHLFKEDCQVLPVSVSLSPRWSIVWHPWLFQQVVSQAPQYFRFWETQTTCCGYFACQSVSLVISTDSSMFMYTLWNYAACELKIKNKMFKWESWSEYPFCLMAILDRVLEHLYIELKLL